MNEEKPRGIICQFIDFIREATSEEEEGWEKTSALNYEIMNFIYRHKQSATLLFEHDFFCSSLKKVDVHDEKANFSCEEAISFGIERGWIEEIEDKISITEYGLSYEKDFWKSFR